MALNASLNGLLFVFDALLEFDDSILSVLLLLLDVLHQLVENVFGLKFLFLGHSVLLELSFEDLLLALEGDLVLGRADAGGDEILLHAVKHVFVGGLSHHFFVYFSVTLLEGIGELLQACLNLVDRAFSVDLLLFKGPDLFGNLLEV